MRANFEPRPSLLRSRKPSVARLSGILTLLIGVKTPDLCTPTFRSDRSSGDAADGILLLTAKVGAYGASVAFQKFLTACRLLGRNF